MPSLGSESLRPPRSPYGRGAWIGRQRFRRNSRLAPTVSLGAIALGGPPCRYAPPNSSMGRPLRDLAAIHWPASSGPHGPAGAALSWGAWHRELLCRVPRPWHRRSSDWRRRTHLAGRAAPQGTGPLPRHGGKWLRISETFPALG